ncbi:uncharacterized protein LOC121996294 isoform X1 [Zingiber officinale]|uniref:uncharacterized protein LOC121996294 isoform X1 n=1 Tax=Zingiber officinale TaxID=94328 RepID=UPI001C4C9F7D|nr:uncharacterized protein LOC121996294 isoform X1 [Zingiber officinale]
MKECKLIGLKSHDCHIIMQRLIPIAFRELLPNFVWGAITELSIFLHDICSTVLRQSHMEKLERDIPIILCNLERIFPPSFFDSMEHLLIHLPYEAKVGGPVHFRWMYPFERFLYHLKKKIKNKAHVEASIVNAYIVEKVTTFASYYFEPHVQSKRQRSRRNDEGPIDPNLNSFSIFNYLGRSSGPCKQRYLTGQEWRASHTYILLNCPEVSSFYELVYIHIYYIFYVITFRVIIFFIVGFLKTYILIYRHNNLIAYVKKNLHHGSNHMFLIIKLTFSKNF